MINIIKAGCDVEITVHGYLITDSCKKDKDSLA